MKNPRVTVKERNLLKGSMRRVFSRSELRRQVISRSQVEYTDPKRPRVRKWSRCENCKDFVATYQMEVDHITPVIPLDKTLEELTWDEVIDRLWCNIENLQGLCLTCHKEKSKVERVMRKKNRKEST